MQALERNVLQAVLEDGTWEATGNTLWSRSALDNDPIVNFQKSTVPKWSHQRSAVPLSSYNELSHIDYELSNVVKEVAEAIDDLSSPVGDPEKKAVRKLEEGIIQVKQGLSRILAILTDTNEAVSLRQAMVERYGGVINGMDQAKETIRARKIPQCPPRTYYNRKC
jgi:hypothetical protein